MENEIIGNRIKYGGIRQWLHNYKPSKNGLSYESLMVVLGPHGIGKTTRITQLVKECQMWPLHIQPYNCQSSKDLSDLIFKACTTHNLSQLFSDDANLQKCIIIDEYETLVSNDRNITTTLVTLITKSKCLSDVPIILICDLGYEKKLSDLKKSKMLVSLGPVDVPSMFVHFSEHPLFKALSSQIVHEACVQSRGNYVFAIQLLNLQLTHSKIHKSDIEPVREIKGKAGKEAKKTGGKTSKKTIVVSSMDGMDDSIDLLDMFRCDNASKVFEILQQDAWINPMRLHENLPSEIDFRKGTKSAKEMVYVKCLEHFINWDDGMSKAEDTLESAVQILALGISHELSILPRKKTVDDTSLHNFTKILSQMSLQKKHERTWYQKCIDHNIPTNISSHLVCNVFKS